MAHPLRTWRTLALVGAGSLALAACGSNGSSNAASSAPPSAGSGSSAAATGGDQADGTLTIGSALPQTGSLQSLGPPEFAGIKLALSEINNAGGVLGKPVKYIEGDSGDTTQDIANPTVDRLLSQKVDAIIGAASSGVSKNIIDKIVNAGVVEFSPANTAPDFTDYPDKGLYFRTAPSDVLQGRVLGETILADGNTSVGILAKQDPYGVGLAANIQKAMEAGGGSLSPAQPVYYPEGQKNFSSVVNAVKAADPDAIAILGFDESASVVQALQAAGIGQGKKQLYFVDGNLTSSTLAKLPKGTLDGARGTQPALDLSADFRKKLVDVYGPLTSFSYAPESYDAVTTIALAATVAKSDAGAAIAKALPDVTRGGTKCTSFATCNDLLKKGTTDIDYDGASGPIEFSDKGDPTQASIGVYTFDASNKYDGGKTEFVTGKLTDQ